MTIQITPHIWQTLWHYPYMGANSSLTHHYRITGAPWLGHRDAPGQVTPWLQDLHDRHLAAQPPIDVTDGVTTVHADPRITALKIVTRPNPDGTLDHSVVVNVGWYDASNVCIHGVQYTESLRPGDHDWVNYDAWRDHLHAQIPVRLS